MGFVRPPAVAGLFYPDRAPDLQAMVDGFLAEAPRGAGSPKALIAPHAGYVYSGPVAAHAFRRVEPGRIERVVVIGPSHYVRFAGIAVPSADAFRTPLGDVAVDRGAVDGLAGLVVASDRAHRQEHSIEVELPFLQRLLGDFRLVPLVVGDAAVADVAAVLERVWGGEETLIVVSSDLSHYLDHAAARRVDAETAAAIERLDDASLGPARACGWLPVAALLALAQREGLRVERLDLRNSGDTAGPKDSVVGYGAWAFRQPTR